MCTIVPLESKDRVHILPHSLRDILPKVPSVLGHIPRQRAPKDRVARGDTDHAPEHLEVIRQRGRLGYQGGFGSEFGLDRDEGVGEDGTYAYAHEDLPDVYFGEDGVSGY